MPIECADRDAAFVLDSLLYNESDLEIEEHYTDTYGYTELNFAAFAMLGRRFLQTHQGRKAPAHLSHRRHNGFGQFAHIVGRADQFDPVIPDNP
jgi:TnpA family transposase